MRHKRTIIYITAAIIAAGLYYLDTWQGREKKRSEEQAKRLVHMESDAMDAIIIKKDGVPTPITLKRIEGDDRGNWTITSPIRTEADRFAVENLGKNLARLKYKRLINEGAEDVSPFGLTDPSLSIHYHSGEESGVLSFGYENPTGDGFYASTGNNGRVYLMSAGSFRDIDKSLFDLRKKDLFDLSLDGLEKFTLVRGSDRWDFIRKDGQWVFTDNTDFQVDSPRVDALVRRVLVARASSFEKERPVDLDTYGLDSPRARITLKGKDKTEEISFGKTSRDDESKIYALTGGTPSRVVTVDKWILADIPQDRAKLRQETEEENHEKKGPSRPRP